MNQNLGIADSGMDDQDNHKVSIRQLGAASLVLLRNQKNTLPIQPSVVKTIAVIGEDAQRDPKQVAYCTVYCAEWENNNSICLAERITHHAVPFLNTTTVHWSKVVVQARLTFPT